MQCKQATEASTKGPAFIALHQLFDQVNEFDDLDTADLFTEVSCGIDKWLWFVEARLQAERDSRRHHRPTTASGTETSDRDGGEPFSRESTGLLHREHAVSQRVFRKTAMKAV